MFFFLTQISVRALWKTALQNLSLKSYLWLSPHWLWTVTCHPSLNYLWTWMEGGGILKHFKTVLSGAPCEHMTQPTDCCKLNTGPQVCLPLHPRPVPDVCLAHCRDTCVRSFSHPPFHTLVPGDPVQGVFFSASCFPLWDSDPPTLVLYQLPPPVTDFTCPHRAF